MSKIETDGFLSEESENGKRLITKKYSDAFNFARDLNRFCMDFLNKLKINWENTHCLIVNTLFLRVLEHFQAIYLMVERGMLIPAKVLTRASLETLFILVALVEKPELIQCYIDQNKEGHKRYLKAALQFQNKSLKAIVKRINVENIYVDKKKDLKDKNPNILKPKQWAIEAGLEDFYNLYYLVYSNTIHSNLSALEDHIDVQPYQIDLSFGPSDKELYELLQCNFYILFNSVCATASVNKLDLSKKMEKISDEIRKLDRKFIEPMS